MSAGFQSDQYVQTAVVSDTRSRTNANAMNCVDPDLLDWCLADLDEQLGRQLDASLHHPAFQALESTWRGLAGFLRQAFDGGGRRHPRPAELVRAGRIPEMERLP
ncbi:type VI secretion system contractile sheath domain-containing protein [Burkholderia ubonensis]|uniref:type VI secretion system contractile sheath domain-containing protein n=2 Tax=Burkholderia ubonensis TaxID=101571 RepID=UPI0039F20D2F